MVIVTKHLYTYVSDPTTLNYLYYLASSNLVGDHNILELIYHLH